MTKRPTVTPEELIESLRAENAEFRDRIIPGANALIKSLTEQNAKLREALTRITKITWGWDGDCGADAIAHDALEP